MIFLVGKPDQTNVIGKRQMAIQPFFLPIVEKCIELNLKYPKIIIGLFTALFVLSIGGITQLRNDFSFLAQIKPHVEWRQHTEKVEQEMGGTLRMSYMIDTGIAEGVKNPALLRHIEKIQRFAEQQPLVRKSLSVADVIKDLNLTFHANDQRYYKVPDDSDLLAQLLSGLRTVRR